MWVAHFVVETECRHDKAHAPNIRMDRAFVESASVCAMTDYLDYGIVIEHTTFSREAVRM